VPSRWRTGDHVVVRYLWLGRVFGAVPATVVDDAASLALWVAPGAGWRRPRAQLTPAEIAAGDWRPEDTTWFGEGVLMISRPGDAHSIWLFWTREGTFDGWYVNLEEPRRRTYDGVVTRDHLLDLVIEADGSWRWKDVDDVPAAVAAGLLSDGEAAAVWREAERVLAERDRLLPTGFEDWRPDPDWPLPMLPEDWDHVP
jgi:Protein of unknown function (DUF402)